MVVISIIHSKERKEKPEIFKFPARWHFFLFTLSWILGILMKYLCINCIFWDSLESARPAGPLRHAAGVTAPRQRQALSVTFGDTSPRGRGTGVSVRPTRDEQSLLYPKTVVPCGLDSQQLDKVLLSRSRCPRKRGPLFRALSGLGRPAESGPARQWLPLWGSWHRVAMTERATARDAPKRLRREE